MKASVYTGIDDGRPSVTEGFPPEEEADPHDSTNRARRPAALRPWLSLRGALPGDPASAVAEAQTNGASGSPERTQTHRTGSASLVNSCSVVNWEKWQRRQQTASTSPTEVPVTGEALVIDENKKYSRGQMS